MPSRDFSSGVMSGPGTSCATVCPDWVAGRVRDPCSGDLLLLDVRRPDEFARSRVRGALGVSLPASVLVLRRLSDGKLSVSSVLREARQRNCFEERYRDAPVVLYDADGTYADAQVTGVLVQRLRQDGCQVFCLVGEWWACTSPSKYLHRETLAIAALFKWTFPRTRKGSARATISPWNKPLVSFL